jgi:hypothetical protein
MQRLDDDCWRAIVARLGLTDKARLGLASKVPGYLAQESLREDIKRAARLIGAGRERLAAALAGALTRSMLRASRATYHDDFVQWRVAKTRLFVRTVHYISPVQWLARVEWMARYFYPATFEHHDGHVELLRGWSGCYPECTCRGPPAPARVLRRAVELFNACPPTGLLKFELSDSVEESAPFSFLKSDSDSDSDYDSDSD